MNYSEIGPLTDAVIENPFNKDVRLAWSTAAKNLQLPKCIERTIDSEQMSYMGSLIEVSVDAREFLKYGENFLKASPFLSISIRDDSDDAGLTIEIIKRGLLTRMGGLVITAMKNQGAIVGDAIIKALCSIPHPNLMSLGIHKTGLRMGDLKTLEDAYREKMPNLAWASFKGDFYGDNLIAEVPNIVYGDSPIFYYQGPWFMGGEDEVRWLCRGGTRNSNANYPFNLYQASLMEIQTVAAMNARIQSGVEPQVGTKSMRGWQYNGTSPSTGKDYWIQTIDAGVMNYPDALSCAEGHNGRLMTDMEGQQTYWHRGRLKGAFNKDMSYWVRNDRMRSEAEQSIQWLDTIGGDNRDHGESYNIDGNRERAVRYVRDDNPCP